MAQSPKYKTLVVNLCAGPGAGKTTLAHRLVADLAMHGFLTEYVSEVAKELIYDERRDLLDGTLHHQLLISAAQRHRIDRLDGKVQIVVTDSPAFLGYFYLQDETDAREFYRLFREDVHRPHRLDVCVGRINKYDTRNRKHSEAAAKLLHERIIKFFLSESPKSSYIFNRDAEDSYQSLLECIEQTVSAADDQ